MIINENVLCKYIIIGGVGKYGKNIIVVVFESKDKTLFWNTTHSCKALQDFKENERYNISYQLKNTYDDRYIERVNIERGDDLICQIG